MGTHRQASYVEGGDAMLTPDYIRETILLARQWDPEYAKTILERVKVTVPWLMKEPAQDDQPRSPSAAQP